MTGTFTIVPTGDAIMSPANRTNPDTTDAEGHFGWDVVAGFYKVRAEKAGCVAPFDASQAYVETEVLVIPPPVTDLDLRLDCGSGPTITASAGGPYSVDEGASVTVTASGSDPAGGTLTYTWDLDNDGTFETLGQSAIFSAASLDGPSSYTIAVQVTNSGGLTATDSTTVNVLNVLPTASFTGTPDTLIEGQSATLAFSSPFDPGMADTAAGFLYSYDCTNDDTFEVAGSKAASYTCAYPTAGSFAARGRIVDKDGGFTDYTVEVIVLTPKEAIEGLIDQVQSLIDEGALNLGQGNALIAKLEAAIQQLGRGNVKAAVNQLGAFANQVNEMNKSGILSPADGLPLLDAANAIIAALGG